MTPRLSPAELAGRIEAAIKLAAKLGADAFDHIEGRGLFYERQEIAAAVEALSKDAARLDWLQTLNDGDTLICPPGHHGGADAHWLLATRSDDYRDPPDNETQEYEAPTIRECIDAARSPIPGPLNV